MSHPDTIVAAATPPGRGGVGVVRVSGPKVPEIAATLVGELPQPRHATLSRFLDKTGEPIDVGLVLFFPDRIPIPVNTSSSCKDTADPLSSSAWLAAASNWARAARGRASSPNAPFTTTRSISLKPKPLPI